VGRLFWKFFLFVWLAQLAGIFGTGLLFWLERHDGHLPDQPPSSMEFSLPPRGIPGEAPPPPPLPPGMLQFRPGEEGKRMPPPPGWHGIPVMHVFGALLASLACAAGLAWYVAKPVSRLKAALAATAEGNFDQRVRPAMGRRRDELADLGQDFDRMNDRLRQSMEAQKRLLHDVSHELRSPLARLQAAIGLARQQPERMDETLSRLEREGERMNVLVGELLTLSRLEAGVSGALESIDLNELLTDLVEDARFEAASREVRVDLVEAPGLRVQANPELLHRAVENVVRNALRYSPCGALVRLETARLDNRVCRISVMDQGPGVRESELEAIFQPFHRGGCQGDGYGLGLAIAQRVFAAVNGKIRAKNRPEGGLLVEMELPEKGSA
jgi:signal transduction histidine kinase